MSERQFRLLIAGSRQASPTMLHKAHQEQSQLTTVPGSGFRVPGELLRVRFCVGAETDLSIFSNISS